MSSNEQEIKRKSELKIEIEAMERRLTSSASITLRDGPYANSEMHRSDKVKIVKLLEEYNALVNVFYEETIVMDKQLSFSDSRYVLKYNPQKNRWDLYEGTVYMTSDVVFTDDENAVATHRTITSDQHGEGVNHVYIIKCKVSPDPIVERAKAIPCTKVEEGLGMVTPPNRDYMESLGFVFDKLYHTWRRPTPEEYEQKQKADPNYIPAKGKEVKKKGVSFSSFLGRGNR